MSAAIDRLAALIDRIPDSTHVTADKVDVRDVLEENERLTAELAKYVGWEPTVREEYQHACAVAERAEEAVRAFKRDHEHYLTHPGNDETVTAFVVALENALEMT